MAVSIRRIKGRKSRLNWVKGRDRAMVRAGRADPESAQEPPALQRPPPRPAHHRIQLPVLPRAAIGYPGQDFSSSLIIRLPASSSATTAFREA